MQLLLRKVRATIEKSKYFTIFSFSLFYSAGRVRRATKKLLIISFLLLVDTSRKAGLGEQRAGSTIRAPKAGGFLCFTAGLLPFSCSGFQIGRGQPRDRLEGDVDIGLRCGG
ncbi:MAG: hypothetical protein VYB26_01380, partial [Pseudomonadota bacterium]|nr:hypothetical protein [Pseudomonadota bacterium]